MSFSAAHRGGSGPPLLLLHGFTDTWRTWELVLPALERHHEVFAPTLPGHAGGAPLPEPATDRAIVDAVERSLDELGWARAHVAGNSMGAYLGLLLAARGRALSVVALAPAGGWAKGDARMRETLEFFLAMRERTLKAVASADEIAASPGGRRAATRFITERFEHLPPDLVAHQIVGAARCDGTPALVERGLRDGWEIDAARIDCPVRIVWGTADRILTWPEAAARYREEWLPDADWVELEAVGHSPQLDVPLETARLILGVTAR